MRFLNIISAAIALASAPLVQAQFNAGDTWYGNQHYGGTLPAPSDGIHDKLKIVNGIEFRAATSYGGWTVDLDGNRVVFGFPNEVRFPVPNGNPAVTFNGFWVADVTDAHPPFKGFVIDPASTLPAPRLIWTENSLFVDFKGLHALPGDKLIITSAVPEIPVWLMGILGFGVIAARVGKHRDGVQPK